MRDPDVELWRVVAFVALAQGASARTVAARLSRPVDHVLAELKAAEECGMVEYCALGGLYTVTPAARGRA